MKNLQNYDKEAKASPQAVNDYFQEPNPKLETISSKIQFKEYIRQGAYVAVDAKNNCLVMRIEMPPYTQTLNWTRWRKTVRAFPGFNF